MTDTSQPVACEVGGAIRCLRLRRKLSLRALSEALDGSIHWAQLSNIERGKPTNLDNYDAIARALGVTREVLFRPPRKPARPRRGK